jgi:N utilization substance protein B
LKVALPGVRRRAREAALQFLYQIEFTGDVSETALDEFWRSRGAADPPERPFAESLVRHVVDERPRIDRIVDAAAENWQVERIARMDLNLLRLAVAELIAAEPLPAEIVINEAIEIARKYCDGASSSFINGVLDRVARDLDTSRAHSDETR